MLISGLEKLSLLDYPGRLTAIVFTYGCNMICPYCHNPELVTVPLNKQSVYSESDVLNFMESRIGKLDALTITGGEPTLHPRLLRFIEQVKELGYEVKLDTNGSNPDKVEEILASGLVDYWAMDVKYSDELYKQGLNGGRQILRIGESIEMIKGSGVDYEFRTTYMKGLHTLDSAREIGEMIKGAKRYFIQNFRPGKTIDHKLDSSNSFTRVELEKIQEIARQYVKEVNIR